MSKILLQANPLGGGDVTIQSQAGTVPRVLTLPDADAELGTKWKYLTPVVASGGINLDISIPEACDEIEASLEGISPAGTTAQILQARWGAAGTPLDAGYASVVGSIAGAAAQANLATGMWLSSWSAVADTANGIIRLSRRNGNIWEGTWWGSRGTAVAYFGYTLGPDLGGTLNIFRLTHPGGVATIDAGTVRVKYR